MMDTPEKLDELTPHQLISEVKQIVEQYSREVTTARRTWPLSVKNRVLALSRLGIARERIASLVGVPKATVFLWCRKVEGPKAMRSSRFLSLPESKSKSNPTVGTNSGSDPGLRVVLPGDVSVSGFVSVEQVLELYRGVRA